MYAGPNGPKHAFRSIATLLLFFICTHYYYHVILIKYFSMRLFCALQRHLIVGRNDRDKRHVYEECFLSQIVFYSIQVYDTAAN